MAIIEILLTVSRDLATTAIDEAIAESGDPDKIAEAEAALASGDALRPFADPFSENSQFKEVATLYELATVNADGAIG